MESETEPAYTEQQGNSNH